MAPAHPVVRIVVDYTPATGETEVRFDAGGQQFAANVLLDVVGQIAERMVPQDPKESAAVLRGVVAFLLNAANQVITQKLKPGVAEVQRIHRVGG
jgi:hypothetical protein